MEKVSKETSIMKLYYKGNPSAAKFYSEEDKSYKGSAEDCKTNKILTNRVFGKSIGNTENIVEGKDKLVYPNFEITRCLYGSESSDSKTAYYNIFTVPKGEKLSEKCLHEKFLDKDNNCNSHLKLISSGLLNGIKLFNIGTKFFKHANIRPHNVYLYRRNDTEKVYLDNMLYDHNLYDDINDKPYKFDLNMLGDFLLKLLTGSKKPEEIIKKAPESTFEIYSQIKKYFVKNSIDINLKTSDLNIGEGIFDYLGKCVTKAEFEYKLKKSIFNFIYKLKCSGTNPIDQFMDIRQAMDHDFIKSGSSKRTENINWEITPADY